MRFSSKSLPENVRRLMPKEARKEYGKLAMTNEEATAKFSLKREKELQENIASLLRQRNIVFFRQRMDRKTTGTVGWTDFTFAINGRACAVECKLPGQMPTIEQYECMSEMITNGWRVKVVTSEAEFLAFLNEQEGQRQPEQQLEHLGKHVNHWVDK